MKITPPNKEPVTPNAQWHVYMVSCADGTLYTGIAKDLQARIDAHNCGKGARYTRGRRPVVLVYAEQADSHGTALRREYAIKKLKASEKRRLVSQMPYPALPSDETPAGANGGASEDPPEPPAPSSNLPSDTPKAHAVPETESAP